MKKIKGGATIDKLARMTAQGFEAVDKKFGAIEEKIDEEIGALRGELKNFATKSDLAQTEERLLTAINGIEIKRPEFEILKNDVKDLSHRVSASEKK